MSIIHLCIDFQKFYIDDPEKGHEDVVFWWPQAKDNIVTLIDALKAHDVPTLYIGCLSPEGLPASVFSAVRPLAEQEVLRDYDCVGFDLPLSPHDRVAFKEDYSAYRNKAIRDYVAQENPSLIILSGVFEQYQSSRDIWNSSCVSQTAIDFREAGYDVVIAAEATNAGAREQIDWPGVWSLKTRQKKHRAYGVDVRPTRVLLQEIALRRADVRREKSGGLTLGL